MEEEDSSSKLLSLSTPLYRLASLGRLLNLNGYPIFAKWEGANPTGTHKDRAALSHVISAKKNGVGIVTVGTCGNYGAALAYYAKLYGVKAVIYVPRLYENSRITEMKRYGATVIPVDGKYEDAVTLSAKRARENGWYDANPSGPNDQTSLASYSRIAYEITAELSDAPYAISIPVGNGTTLVGVYLGFLQLYKEGCTTRIPRIVAATTTHANQLAVSWARGSLEPVELPESEVRETWVNEPLAAVKSLNAHEALKALRYSEGDVYAFEDEEMLEAALALKAVEGIDALPASAASILALRRFASLESIEGPLVALVTGRWRARR